MKALSLVRRELGSLSLTARYRTGQRLRGLGNDAIGTLGARDVLEEDLGEQWRRILKRSEDVLKTLPPAGAPRVLFGTVWGSVTAAHAIESTMAMALRLRGATPIVLACDHALPACEWNPFGNFEPPPGPHGPPVTPRGRLDRCRLCMLHLSRSHELPGLERVSLSDFLRPDDRERAQRLAEAVPLSEMRDFALRDLNVGEHAYASLLRATLRGTPLDDARTRCLATRYLMAAILVAELGERLLSATRPDRFVAVHGFYVTQGTLAELARKRGVHVVIHGQPYRHGTIWLSHHDSYQRTLTAAADRRWEELEMTPERIQIAEEYLASKELVARDYTSYHVGSIRDPALIRAALDLDERPIVSLFTNILWDAQIHYRSNVFPNMLAWLFATIRHFQGRPDLQLAIRLHPAEALAELPTLQPLAAEIAHAFPELPSNVKLVPPASRISSYALAAMSRAALVYGARMGVEIVLLGVPVIVTGEAFMRGRGFTLDPSSSSEYFALLERVSELGPVPDAARKRALKWYYHYFFRLMLPFPYYRAQKDVTLSRPRLDYSSLEELLPGRSNVLDLVCAGIKDGATPFEWDAVS